MGARRALAISAVLAAASMLISSLLCAATFAPDEILVRYKQGRRSLVAASAAKNGWHVEKSIDAIRFQVVKLPKGISVESALQRLKTDPDVEYAGPNHHIRICTDPPQVWPSDPVFFDGYDLLDLGVFIQPNQLGLYNNGYNLGFGGTARADIHAPEAWAITTGSPDIIIANLDTGVDSTHPDLNGPGKMLPGYNTIDNTSNSMDDNGHGTFTAGISAACSDNEIGITGVSWGSRILPIKVIAGDGVGTEADGAEGILWAVDHGAKILNMSFATDVNAPALESAIDYAWSHGCLPVCASGNENVGVPRWPAAYTHALAVGATNEYDQRCTADDWPGPPAGGSNYGSYLDVMAPGNNITSTWSDPEPMIGQIYIAAPGTSAAAPFVSGIAALIWTIHPTWTNQQVMDQIMRTADDKGDPGWDQYYGWGRANAYRALTETTSAPVSDIGALKKQPVGAYAELTGKVITGGTAQISTMIYIEEPNRSCGIMAYYPSGVPSGLLLGDRVNAKGTLGTRNGELVLTGATISKLSTGTQLRPLGITGKTAIGAAATLTQGLLVTACGKVTEVGWDYFYIDDGSGLLDSLGAFAGLRVNVPSTSGIAIGNTVSVIGLMGRDTPPGATSPVPVVRPRKPADIKIHH